MPPDVQLYHEDENGAPAVWSPKPTQYQVYLWDLLDRQLSEVAALVKKRRIVLLFNGDITQGQKYPDLWVSTRPSDQIEIAQATADFILKRLPQIDTVRIAFGTPSHEFGEGSSARLLWKHIESNHRRVNVKAVSHGIADVAGVSFDYAHHGPGASQRVWLNGNQARYYLKDIMLSDILGVALARPHLPARGIGSGCGRWLLARRHLRHAILVRHGRPRHPGDALG